MRTCDRYPAILLVAILASISAAGPASAQTEDRVRLGAFAIDRTEVTIAAFERFAAARNLRTAAEREGGGFEYAAGWTRRPGWTFRTPSGQPGAPDDPAVHVSWSEARDHCASVGGRLPSFAEWRQAAYTEQREVPENGFVRRRTYPYAVGDDSAGMNTSGSDQWKRHAPAGATRRGVNGLYDMGGNVWEWLADRRGSEALTAGGSWWYGLPQTQADGAQWKAADFYAVYVGFRCAYDAG
ncbi:formylglycine-generating enzyme family protein [Bosea caraganae]|uniref:Formylglycine-generating enzyme family protein n=2 Tax=Bosea caraganae TaxID=2763117 RepID=A0A370L6N2_9HYPH|nr:formylglycine-generating enzyme family protein [Bosea caraganae]RDJ23506.1 formylglycine-generating enzyme family protein [Bosea caraganae]RDJ24796.1 formylglycine-generating enzyme family protein [Bosea caraganae]